MDFELFGSIFNKLNESSMIHWYAILFGDWIKLLFGSVQSEVITNPITPLTAALSATNFISLVAVGFVLAGSGVEAFFSGFATTNIASGMNPQIVAVRLAIFFVLFIPHSLPESAETSGKDKWVYITTAQANMVRLGITGGAIADWVWGSVSPYLIKLDFGGGSILKNNVLQSKDYAQAMLCNEVYYQNKKKTSQSAKRFYVTRTFISTKKIHALDGSVITQFPKRIGTDSLSNIDYTSHMPLVKQKFDIHLGGSDELCGSFTIDVPKKTTTPLNSKSRLETVMARVAQTIMINAVDEAFQFAKDIEQTAINAYGILSKLSHESLVAISDNKDFNVEPVNVGSLKTIGYDENNISKSINSIADNFIYSMMRTAYVRKEIGCASFGQVITDSCKSNLYLPVNSIAVDHKALSEMLNNYIMIGSFWRSMNELSAVMPIGSNYLQGNNVKLYPPKEKDFCESSNWFSFSFDNKNDELYECNNLALASSGIDSIFNIVVKKLNKDQFPLSLNVGSGVVNPISDVNNWRLFSTSARKDDSSGLADYNTSWLGGLMLGLFETAWWVGEDNGTMVDSGAASDYTDPVSLFGGEGLVNNITGQRSPYTFLAQFSSGLQEIYITANAVLSVIQAVSNATLKTQEQFSSTIMDKSWGGLVGVSFALNLAGELGMSVIATVMQMLSIISKLMLMGSIVISYVMPLIPLVGWIFIILGVIFITTCAVGAISFSLILMVVPKGDSLLPNEFARIMSLIYGVFIRQPMLVVGFIISASMSYVAFSLVNFLFFPASLVNQSSVGFVDSFIVLTFTLIAYPAVLFFSCTYCFGRTSAFVEVVGSWLSPQIAGGVFGADSGEERQSISMLQNIGGQLDSMSQAMGINPNNGGKSERQSRNRNRGA